MANISLDGYTTGKGGNIHWTEPSGEVFSFITNLIRPTQTHLYGRHIYETMIVWKTDPNLTEESPLMHDFAEVWQSAKKLCPRGCWRRYPLVKLCLSNHRSGSKSTIENS